MTYTKILRYSPCVVQVPDHPPRRLRRPLDLVRAEVYCHLKAAYRLSWQTLRHHHRCRRPEEEGGQRDAKMDKNLTTLTDIACNIMILLRAILPTPAP